VPPRPPPAPRSGHYTVPSTPGVGLECAPDCAGVEPLTEDNVGGYSFAPNFATPLHVAIDDDVTHGPVEYAVCQDLDADGSCGDASEPLVTGCGTDADLGTSPVPFARDAWTTVFVYATGTLCPANVATSGWISLDIGDDYVIPPPPPEDP
jgi:hypothetical protein